MVVLLIIGLDHVLCNSSAHLVDRVKNPGKGNVTDQTYAKPREKALGSFFSQNLSSCVHSSAVLLESQNFEPCLDNYEWV